MKRPQPVPRREADRPAGELSGRLVAVVPLFPDRAVSLVNDVVGSSISGAISRPAACASALVANSAIGAVRPSCWTSQPVSAFVV